MKKSILIILLTIIISSCSSKNDDKPIPANVIELRDKHMYNDTLYLIKDTNYKTDYYYFNTDNTFNTYVDTDDNFIGFIIVAGMMFIFGVIMAYTFKD